MKFDNIVKAEIPSPDGNPAKKIVFGLACNGGPEDLKAAVKRVIQELQRQEISI